MVEQRENKDKSCSISKPLRHKKGPEYNNSGPSRRECSGNGIAVEETMPRAMGTN